MLSFNRKFFNKYLGIITTYAISLLTDRQLLIKIDKPCKIENYLYPNEINWVYNSTAIKHLTKYELNIDYNKNILLNINVLDFKKDFDLIIVRTGANFVRYLALNSKYHQKIQQLGYTIDNFNLETQFYNWYKKLFKFNNNLEIKYRNLLNITSNKKLICAQVRLGGGRDRTFVPKNSPRLYWDLIKNKFLFNLTDYKLFITTDSKEVIDEANKEFDSNKVIAFKQSSYHIDFVLFPFKTARQCNQMSDLFLDFYFLGQCHMGVVSHSGFGLLGILNRKNLNEIYDNFYVYTDFWNKSQTLDFHRFNTSILYLGY